MKARLHPQGPIERLRYIMRNQVMHRRSRLRKSHPKELLSTVPHLRARCTNIPLRARISVAEMCEWLRQVRSIYVLHELHHEVESIVVD